MVIRDSTINIPIDVSKEAINKFIDLLNNLEDKSTLQHNELRILLEDIANSLRIITKR